MIEKPFILAGKKLSTRLVFPPLATESSDGGKPNEKSHAALLRHRSKPERRHDHH